MKTNLKITIDDFEIEVKRTKNSSKTYGNCGDLLNDIAIGLDFAAEYWENKQCEDAVKQYREQATQIYEQLKQIGYYN